MDYFVNDNLIEPGPGDLLISEPYLPDPNFESKENTGEMAEKTNKKLINVFVPTTPNPTSGFLLMFPIEDVIYLNMTFEEASKFIVSAGTSNKQS